MSQVLEKPILLDETGQDIVDKLDDIKEAIGTSSEFIPVMIKVVTPPTKTIYKVGERLDLSGMVVNLIGTNNVQIDVTQACTFSPANGTVLTSNDTSVAVTYLYQKDSLTFTSSFSITIRELESIAVTTPPTKTAYQTGQTLDLTGIVVTATYSDGYMANVTAQCVYNPANGTVLSSSDTSVSVSYTEGSVTKTTSVAIGVKELLSISVTTPPTKTEYAPSETLDLTGIIVTATYDDGSSLNVTSHCVFSPANGATLTISDTSVSVSYTEGSITKTATQSIVVEYIIYGAEWDGTASSSWTRTDKAASFTDPVPAVNNGNGSSPFDTIQPWAGIERVEDASAGTLVKIPKYYFKWTKDSSKLKLQISSQEFDNSYVSPAHADRGDGAGERDFVYVGAYHCATNDGTHNYKSATGVEPVARQTRSGFRSNIHSLGSDIWQWDFAMYWTIAMLYLVEFADWNSQEKIGYGCSNTGAKENNGACDSMTYHTGTNAATRQTYGHTRYRYIEDLWGNMYDFVDGIYNPSNDMRYYIIKNPADFSDNSNGTAITYKAHGTYTSGLYNTFIVPEVAGFEYALYPSNIIERDSPDYSTYICDRYDYGSSGIVRYVGGSYDLNQQSGLFYFNDQGTTSQNNVQIGCRLMKLPNS